MKQTKKFLVLLVCLCVMLASVFAFTACKKCSHSDTEWVVTKEATATENGEKSEICKDCETVLSTEVIPALGVPNVPAAPTGLALNGMTITWNAVEGATSYVVKFGDTTYTTTTTTFDFSTLSLTALTA